MKRGDLFVNKLDKDQSIALINDYANTNMIIGDIAKKYNISESCVNNYVNIYNTPKRKSRLGDLTGKRFGMMTVLYLEEIVYHTPVGSKYGVYDKLYMCQCDCGKYKKYFQKDLNSKRAAVKSCGCYQYNSKNGESVINSLFNHYKNGAKSRNIKFNLSKDDFVRIIKMDCYYCGIAAARVFTMDRQIGSFICNGIDRFNNSKGYTVKNCVPCCSTCNMAKKGLEFIDFKSWVNNIFNKKNYYISDISGGNYEYDNRSINHWFREYMKGSSRRGVSFEINIEDFKNVVSKNCFYCGAKPSRVHYGDKRKGIIGNKYNGVDRKDNNTGYTIVNSVPCCTNCNMGKRVMSQQEFFKWSESVYWNLNLKEYE